MKDRTMNIIMLMIFFVVSTPKTDTHTLPFEIGIASWYGPGFHGRLTASGVKYDQNLMTAAHRTLPLGTLVRVTNLETDKQVEVCINDRGPYVKGRLIDLSAGAARVLEMKHRGTARVKVEVLGIEDVD
jgi:rare lipoprotein A